MRLVEIYNICKNNYVIIKQLHEDIKQICKEYRKIRDMKTSSVITSTEKFELAQKMNGIYMIISKDIGDIKYLERTIKPVEEVIFSLMEKMSLTDTIDINKDEEFLDDIEYALQTVVDLLSNMRFILEFCESLGVSTGNIGLDIKIPETNNITEFKKYVDDLEFIFTKCPFFKMIKKA